VNKTRLEAFSDAVIAIIMTIMVLELKIPITDEKIGIHGDDIWALWSLRHIFLAYLLSFIYLGIYWNNHHHMLQATRTVNGKVLWANMHLLFWLSLVPFATGWMGENHYAPVPTAVYGVVLLMAGVSYTILQNKLVHHSKGENSFLAEAVGSDRKGKLSIGAYIVAIGLAFVNQHISQAIYALVAIMWFIPDRRIEDRINKKHEQD
jgi:uncharacterized membrane protein